MRSLFAKCISIACVFALLALPLAGEDVRSVRFPVSNYSAPDTQWVPPPPQGRPVLDAISGDNAGSGIYYGSRVLMAAGGLLCAGGIVLTTRGFSDNMNSQSMHTGGLLIISGALVSALFSVAARATGARKDAEAAQTSDSIVPE